MSNTIIAIALAAVFIVLVLGLFNMMRGGDSNRSQMLMRWRVGLQFAAILIVLLIVWLKGR
jgi:hypothetical protein